MKKISVVSNIANRIKKIREGVVYQEWTCFVGELIQNAQRAKAKNIYIDVQKSFFRIRDDGKGCISPENVFTLDFSGWDKDVYSPFGEGFSSTFAIADQIKVRSKNWKAFFDLKKALETKNFDSVEIEETEYINGFEVILHFLDSYDISKIEEETKKIGSMITPNVYLNGRILDKRNISFEPFTIRKRLRGFGEIVAAPADHGYLEIIYEGRPVREIYSRGLKGILALRPGSVTLRAPDRKDIIYDDKRRSLEERLNELTREIFTILIKDYREQINKFSSVIEDILPPSLYAKYLNYGLFDNKKPNPNSTPREYCVANLAKEEKRTQNFTAGMNIIPTSSNSVVKREHNYNSKEIKQIRKMIKKGTIFYRLHEETKFGNIQAKAEYYGITVLVVDKLHGKALEWMGVPHLSNITHSITETYSYSRIGPITRKENRILKLLEPIAKYYKLSPKVFDFADIACVVKTKINNRIVSRKKIYPIAVCDKKENKAKILLSRKQLNIRHYEITYDAELGTAKDLKILMNIVPTIAHELAHLLYNTKDNTLEMFKIQHKIQEEIFQLIAQV